MVMPRYKYDLEKAVHYRLSMDVKRVMRELLTGVAHVHSRKIMHR
jgi:serine/threonine protein kinase